MTTLAPDARGESLGQTSTGLPPRLAACLAYSLWWASGALLLAVEPRNQYVRFHAAQALAGFGLIWLCGIALWGLSFLLAFVSPAAFRTAALVGPLVWALGVLAWLWCLWQAARGRWWRIPGVGEWAAARAAKGPERTDTRG
jgi:uncharacterized membrane protein